MIGLLSKILEAHRLSQFNKGAAEIFVGHFIKCLDMYEMKLNIHRRKKSDHYKMGANAAESIIRYNKLERERLVTTLSDIRDLKVDKSNGLRKYQEETTFMAMTALSGIDAD